MGADERLQTDGTATATVRDAARVILLNGEDEILLFRVDNTPKPGRTLWLPPGGGVNEGESHEAAALRELWEETGLQGATLGPCVWFRSWTGKLFDSVVEQRERYFVVRCEAFEPTRDNFEAHEHEFMAAHRWWRLAEIAESTDYFVPRNLGVLLEKIVSGEIPAEPFDCGV
ncbi:hypothetical protein AYO38_09560 [bacterium SCGC AG-212-C10]|nr:hypothetical protein AYO38_09560 [bacterium SCGC AG-212-C10]